MRTQFHHVIDVAATVLDAAGLPAAIVRPRHPADAAARRLDGAVVRRRRTRAERRETQYFEMFCNRGIYHEGWTAVTRHSIPWMRDGVARRSTTTSGSSTAPTTGRRRTISPASSPRSSHELQQLFLIEAKKYNVLPLDDRRVERFNPDLAGRPELIKGTRQLLFGGMGRLSENSIVALKNKSHAVTAEIEVPDGRAEGVIVAQGGAFGGWTLYAHEGKPAYCYNLFGLQQFKVVRRGGDPRRRAPGPRRVRLRRRWARQGRDVTLYLDGEEVGEGRVDATVPMALLGRRDDRPRLGQRHAGHRRHQAGKTEFTGRVNWVEIDLGDDAADADHLITPEERLRIAMARQ